MLSLGSSGPQQASWGISGHLSPSPTAGIGIDNHQDVVSWKELNRDNPDRTEKFLAQTRVDAKEKNEEVFTPPHNFY
jgi:hypothetical protein